MFEIDMKRFLLILILAISAVPAIGQRIDPDSYSREFSGGVGVRGCLERNVSYGSSSLFWFNYSQFYNRHLGMRIGAEFMPDGLDSESYFGFPIAFSLRTGMRQTSDAMLYGGVLALDLLDTFVWDSDDLFVDMLAVFLLSMVNRAEFHIGLTPGYFFDSDFLDDSNSSALKGLYCSADAGLNFSWRIWRFTLNAAPTIHYNLTGNYARTEEPFRWMFSMNFGLGFLF